MKHFLLQSENLFEDCLSHLHQLSKDPETQSILILSCDNNNLTDEQHNELCCIDKPIFGGIFPQIIYGDKNHDKGVVICGLSQKADIRIIKNLSDNNVDYEEQLDDSILDDDFKTMFVFVDGFASRISAFIDSLFNTYSLELNFIGGGAGSLSMVQKPCILTNDGLLQDVAIIAALKSESGIGVRHGWIDLHGPLRVSDCEKNIIKTLDHKNAFEVYRSIVEEDAGVSFTDDNFFDIAKGYPFGISKLGTEKIVRDPIVLGENGELICVGEVPLNSFVHILKGDKKTLTDASREAFDIATQTMGGSSKDKDMFFVDCISRVLFLENDFKEELESVNPNQLELVGALTLGEIANSGNDYLEFYNKTAVVGLMDKL